MKRNMLFSALLLVFLFQSLSSISAETTMTFEEYQKMRENVDPDAYFASWIANATSPNNTAIETEFFSGRAWRIWKAGSVVELFIRKGRDLSPVVDALATILKNDKYPDARAAAAGALPLTGMSTAIPHLKDALKDKSFIVRFAAADALSRMGVVNDMNALKVCAEIASPEKIKKLTMKDLLEAGVGEPELRILGRFSSQAKDGNKVNVGNKSFEEMRREGVEPKKKELQEQSLRILHKSSSEFAKSIVDNAAKTGSNETREFIRKIKMGIEE